MIVTAGRALRMALTVRNEGDRPFGFEEALHTYIAVGDVREIRISGLEGTGYLDKADGGAKKAMGDAPLTISGETDRVFNGHRDPITIEDPIWRRRLVVERSGSSTAVVWNPWAAKAKAMPDFGDDEWTGMVCVESTNATDDALTLEAGASHEITTTIAVRPA
jgi:glucose-6-phosphate 1-epimerase